MNNKGFISTTIVYSFFLVFLLILLYIVSDLVNNRITLTSTVILKLNAGDRLKLVGVSIEDITYEKARMDIEKID